MGVGASQRSWSRLQAEAAAEDLLHDLGGAAEDQLDAAQPPERTIVSEKSGLMLPPVKTQAPSGQRESRRSRGASWAAITRQVMVSARGSSPSRGVAPTTTPNQRPRISQPSMRTSTPVLS